MKKLGFIVVLLVLSITLFSQSWSASSRLTSTSDISTIVSKNDASGNVYVLGFFDGTLTSNNGLSVTAFGGRDYFICKFGSDGTPQWINNIGAVINDDLFGGLHVSPSGEVFVTGGYLNYLKYTDNDSIFSTGIVDVFLCKYSTAGDVDWCRNICTGANQQRATYLTSDTNGDLFIAGFFRDSIRISDNATLYADNSLYFNAYLAKIEPINGDFVSAFQIHTINSSVGLNILNISVKDDHYTFTGVYTDSIKINNDTLVSENNSYDVVLVNTDLIGNINWYNSIHGGSDELAYGLNEDENDNIYVAGHYDSPSIAFESQSEPDFVINENLGSYDFFIAQYSSNGDLNWAKTNGGKGNDKIASSELFQNELTVSGFFADTLLWGGIELTTNGTADRDMFFGSIDNLGNYRSASGYGGINNSEEDSRSIFHIDDRLFTVIRSDSELLVLGDSIYTSSGDNFYIALGIIGCLPISIDTSYKNVEDCYGYSSGSIRITPTGGFGGPWVYSIDNNQTSSSSDFFEDLPAGDYQVVVVDSEGCSQTGPLVTLTQPDSLAVTYTATDIVVDTLDDGSCTIDITQGSISAVVTGGTEPYEYVLFPGGILQATSGTYFINPGDSGMYVVRVDDFKNCGPVEADSIEVRQFGSGGDCIIDGIEDGLLDQVKIYPNPTTGLFTLEMPYNEAECSMEVYNMNGQIVLQKQLYSNSGKIAETIDLSQASKGLYLIRIDNRALKSAIVVK